MRIASLFPAALVVVSASLLGCPSGSGGGGGTTPQWPTASKLAPKSLPTGASWHGVWFISSPGSRGTMHILLSGEEKFHGCWIAEDKHSRATFVGTFKENVAMFDWTEKRVGFAGAPTRITAYLVMDPQEDGRHKVKGEYGSDLSSDSGNNWEGIKQKNAEPKEDGCKLEEGDTLPGEAKPLQ